MNYTEDKKFREMKAHSKFVKKTSEKYEALLPVEKKMYRVVRDMYEVCGRQKFFETIRKVFGKSFK